MPKRIVVCADGTWNEPGETDNGVPSPTNVSKLAFLTLGALGVAINTWGALAFHGFPR